MSEEAAQSSCTVREYVSADREACLALFDSNRPKYFAEHERPEFAEWLDKPDRASYSVMELHGEIVACGGIYLSDDTAHVGMAWGMVRGDLHGQGLGRQLTQFRLDQMNASYPSLERRLATSQHTFEFYEKMGFVTEKITPDGFGVGIDRYDMVGGI